MGNQAAVGMLFCVHMKAHDYDDEILITLWNHFGNQMLALRMKPVNPCISCRITLHMELLQHKLIQLWFVLDSFWLLIPHIWVRISVMMFDTRGCFFAQKEASLFKHVELDLSIWALNQWHRRFIRDSRISHHRSALFNTSKLTSNSFESKETEQQPLDSKHRMNKNRLWAFWGKISFCFISQRHKWV